MIQVKTLVFNPIQVNTYIVFDETKECIIIDPGCYGTAEEQKLTSIIESNRLKPVLSINTHPHIDHILGNDFILRKFNLSTIMHNNSKTIYAMAKEHSIMFNFKTTSFPNPEKWINDGDIIKFGNTEFQILYTPGHADGSVCLYFKDIDIVFSGDVLFYESIGRTDLPTGSIKVLADSIKNKLFSLPDSTKVYPGHGEETSIGYERKHNPFLIDL